MKKLLSIFCGMLSAVVLFSGCAKKNIYAMPEEPKGEAVATDKNVAKPESVRYFSGGKALDLSAEQIDTVWTDLDDIFNSGYERVGYNDLLDGKAIEEFKREEACLELIYTQIQVSENFSESYKAYRYYGVLIILYENHMRYVKYPSGSASGMSSDGFTPELSGEGFVGAYASLRSTIEGLKE